MTESCVRLAAGPGLIARRATELLFTPTGGIEVVEAFEASAPGGGIDAITKMAEDRSFEIEDFVAIDWGDGVRVAVFGDVEVVSDHRSLPRLSASGAGTWVERSIRHSDDIVTIGVGTTDVEPVTDLRAGVVQAGGFSLVCTPGAGPATGTELSARDRGAEAAAFTESPVPPADPVVASSVEALADQVLTGTVPGTYDDAFRSAPDDITIVPDDAMRHAIDDLVDRAEADDSVLPPLPPLPGVAHTATWQLVFADGRHEPVDRTLVLGRKPTFSDGQSEVDTRLVQLDCSQISGRHLEVRSEGAGVSVTDVGSSNGSFVLTTGDGQLVRLDPGVPHRIDVGMIVQIGTKRFRAEAVTDG